MAKKSSQKSLDSWTKEDWGTKSGKNSTQGKDATGERYLPKKAREALSESEDRIWLGRPLSELLEACEGHRVEGVHGAHMTLAPVSPG